MVFVFRARSGHPDDDRRRPQPLDDWLAAAKLWHQVYPDPAIPLALVPECGSDFWDLERRSGGTASISDHAGVYHLWRRTGVLAQCQQLCWSRGRTSCEDGELWVSCHGYLALTRREPVQI